MSDHPSSHEARIFLLESQVGELQRANARQDEHLESIEQLLRGIALQISNQKSFIAGVVFVITAVAGIVRAAITYFKG